MDANLLRRGRTYRICHRKRHRYLQLLSQHLLNAGRHRGDVPEPGLLRQHSHGAGHQRLSRGQGGERSTRTAALSFRAPMRGSIVYLYRNVRYQFKASVAIPGRTCALENAGNPNTTEELSTPFNATARVNFYNLNVTPAQAAVPALGNIRGLELLLNGMSERTPERECRTQDREHDHLGLFREPARLTWIREERPCLSGTEAERRCP